MIYDRMQEAAKGNVLITPDNASRATDALRYVAVEQFDKLFLDEEERERPPVTLSSSFYCPRKIHYDLQGAEKEPYTDRALNTFWLGRMVEAFIIARMALANVPIVGLEKEVWLTLDGDQIQGHADVVIQANGRKAPVEIKSMSEYGFKRAKAEGIDNTFGYVDQPTLYGAAMDSDRAYFVGVNKSTGHIFEEQIMVDEARVKRVEASYQQAKAGLPERPDWATTKQVSGCEQIENVRCTYCPYRPICWPGFDLVALARGPVWRKPNA